MFVGGGYHEEPGRCFAELPSSDHQLGIWATEPGPAVPFKEIVQEIGDVSPLTHACRQPSQLAPKPVVDAHQHRYDVSIAPLLSGISKEHGRETPVAACSCCPSACCGWWLQQLHSPRARSRLVFLPSFRVSVVRLTPDPETLNDNP